MSQEKLLHSALFEETWAVLNLKWRFSTLFRPIHGFQVVYFERGTNFTLAGKKFAHGFPTPAPGKLDTLPILDRCAGLHKVFFWSNCPMSLLICPTSCTYYPMHFSLLPSFFVANVLATTAHTVMEIGRAHV